MIAVKILKRPTAFLMLFSLLTGIAIYMLPRVPVDLFPEFNPPIIVVLTSYDGAGSEIVEEVISRPMEQILVNVSGVAEIVSYSMENSSMIRLEFGWDVDLTEATNEIRDKLEFAKRFLPDDAETPTIYKIDPSALPMMKIAVAGNRTPEDLRRLTENQLQAPFEQLDGVSMTTINGGRDKLVLVEFYQNRLAAFNLTINQISNTLRMQNSEVAAGSIADGTIDLAVRVGAEFSSIEDIKNSVVAYRGLGDDKKPILLQDLANVKMGLGDASIEVELEDSPVVYLEVQKRSGANLVQTADQIYERLEAARADLPADVELQIIEDTSTIIRSTLSQMTESAAIGAFLAIFVLFLFLRSWRSALIIGLSIPVSLLITIMAMFFFGLTFNIMTMAGLILGLGMIVDSSIVILENIFAYRGKGVKSSVAATLGSQEMFTAITASVLTSVCVFLPVIIFKSELEVIGILFGDLAFTVVISLSASLAVALFLVPILAGKYVPIYTKTQKPIKKIFLQKIDHVFDRFFENLGQAYQGLLKRILRRKWPLFIIVILLLGGSLFLVPIIGLDFMPTSAEDNFSIDVILPQGTQLAETEKALQNILAIVKKEVNGYKQIFVTTGGRERRLSSASSNRGSIQFTLSSQQEGGDSADVIREKIRAHFNEFPGVSISFSEGMRMGGNRAPVDIMVKGRDLVKAKELARKIETLLREEVAETSEESIDVDDGAPQMDIIIDRARANDLGVNIVDIGKEVSAAVNGVTAAVYNQDGNEYDIRLRLRQEDVLDFPDLEKIFVTSHQNAMIPVSNLASLKRSNSPTVINRENQIRILHVTAQLRSGAASSDIDAKIQAMIDENIVIEEGLTVEYHGNTRSFMEYVPILIAVMAIALALVYGVMAGLFDSLLDPLIIFLIIPFMVIGVVAIHYFTGTVINALTVVGLVMLAGIVVNNGIVMVDYTNLLRARGLELRQACLTAAGNRLRPVLMSTLTTVLGMTPLAFSSSVEVNIVQPIGLTVVGGLIGSTLITLLLIPCLYEIFNRRHKIEVD